MTTSAPTGANLFWQLVLGKSGNFNQKKMFYFILLECYQARYETGNYYDGALVTILI